MPKFPEDRQDVHIRIDDEERAMLVVGAEQAQVPVATYVRALIREVLTPEALARSLEDAVIAACDPLVPDEEARAAMLAIVGKVLSKTLKLRGGMMATRDLRMIIDQIQNLRSMPVARIHHTEERRELRVDVKNPGEWEQMVRAARGVGPGDHRGPDGRRALPGNSHPGVLVSPAAPALPGPNGDSQTTLARRGVRGRGQAGPGPVGEPS